MKYTCDCGTKNEIPMYAVAQHAMGHTVSHHCICGRYNLYGRGSMRIAPLPEEVWDATRDLALGNEQKSWLWLFIAASTGVLPLGL